VLASVRRGLVVLERTPAVSELVPNVGSNLVEATPDARDIDDVAGIPGRLFEVKGQLAVPGEPEFGASAHVATVLLAARSAGVPARAALNLRYDPGLVDALRGEGTAVEFDAEEAELPAAIRRAVEATTDPQAVDLLYQTGGFGIEPILYLLVPDAAAVAQRVRSSR
jgi:predicted fused transcriptional regulator/phosphomethylpyrimidine kinase